MRSYDVNDVLAPAFRYAEDVVSGEIDACELVKLTCQRFLKDIDETSNPESIWDFDTQKATRSIVFAQLLPNIKGPQAGKPLSLDPWQRFIYANIFGMVERQSRVRRFRQAIIFCPRGNGKTTMSAPMALYCTFGEREGGAEGYAAAVTRDQARILFDTARAMTSRCPEFRARFGVQVAANAIFQTSTESKFIPISSDAKALDGLNVAIAICDEIGSHRTAEVYDVLLTAMGKRSQPLLVCISTATGNNTGIGKRLWDYSVRVLRGQESDDSLFALIYTIDQEDDPWDERVWRKANPSWGQAVQVAGLQANFKQARSNPAQEAAVKTRHLNVWVGANEQLFSIRAWLQCTDNTLRLEDFEGRDCYVALDLAARIDLASIAITFFDEDEDGRPLYTTFSINFINDAAVQEARNPSYPTWAAEGYLHVTPGNETDFNIIQDVIYDLGRRFNVVSCAYDPWGATMLAQKLTEQGVNMIEYRAQTQNFSEPTKELDAAMRSGRIKHDGNPVLEFCIGNVVGRIDPRGNIFPKKEKEEQKIDAAVALIMTIGLITRDFADRQSVYRERGPLFF